MPHQNTEPWFYRTPGLKIVVPSTPEDARALMAAAIRDPDPVLFYEHIALYRDPRIKQKLPDAPPTPLPLGRAALRRRRRSGGDFLRRIRPCRPPRCRTACGGWHPGQRPRPSIAGSAGQGNGPRGRSPLQPRAHHSARTRAPGVGESLAAIIQEEAFESLDAPVRVIGALDTPVPYSPPLEEFFLPSDAEVERAARLLVSY